ncbi:DUF2188 domain-containing protein [Bacillus marinisedimentorum]|uniref:DUF2188 domain-containing protein n=1 Tax=Bacillus marinisedimentorum TaxID=1821260 RepID=UPI0007E1DDA9|nr:DUF2188 domain-containing protein [Bacillus marinisedimentorum]
MYTYTVVPNKDASAWIVKAEDVAPEQSYISRDRAVDTAKELARENSPASVQVMDRDHQLVDEMKF